MPTPPLEFRYAMFRADERQVTLAKRAMPRFAHTRAARRRYDE